MAPHAIEQFVADISPRDGYGIGVFEGGSLTIAIKRTVGVVREIEDFFIAEAQFAAHGSVDVLSKRAIIQRGDAAVQQCLEGSVDEARLINSAPHGTDTSKNRAPARIEKMVQKRRSPFPGLCIEDKLYAGIDVIRINR